MSNELLEKLKPLAEKIAKNKPLVKNEAHTRAEFVKPFLQILGYDGIEVLVPEYSAGFGNNDKVDYAILSKGKPLAIVEIKHHSVDLDLKKPNNNPQGQLAGYFGACAKNGCKFGILTNGLEYRFFADMQKPNIMDSTPFMVLNLESKIDSESLEILEIFKCGNLQSKIKAIQNKAKVMLEQKAQNAICATIKAFLEKEMDKPSDEFVGFVIDKKFDDIKRKSGTKINDFKKYIVRAFNELIADKADEIIATKEAQNADSQDTSKELNDEENQAFYIVRGILLENQRANLNNICPRGTEKAAYCAVLLDDNKNKWICRLYLKYANKYIETPNAEKLPIKSLADIYKYKNELAESLKMRLR